MKSVIAILVMLVASAFAGLTGVEIKSYSMQGSHGMAIFTFTPPHTEDMYRKMEANILLPGSMEEYFIRECFSYDQPNLSIKPTVSETNSGYITISLDVMRKFISTSYGFVCAFTAPKAVRNTQIGLYLKLGNEETFVKANGGTLPATPFGSYFGAVVAKQHNYGHTRFSFDNIPVKPSSWVLRVGAPLNPKVTTAYTPKFEAKVANPICEVTHTDADLVIIFTVKVSVSSDRLLFEMPPTAEDFTFKIRCDDIISDHGPDFGAILEAHDVAQPSRVSFVSSIIP